MPHVIRARNGGKSFELRIKHRLLQSPFYDTFSTREEAERVAARGLAALEKGETPTWMQRTDRREVVTIAKATQAYRAARAVLQALATCSIRSFKRSAHSRSQRSRTNGPKPGSGR